MSGVLQLRTRRRAIRRRAVAAAVLIGSLCSGGCSEEPDAVVIAIPSPADVSRSSLQETSGPILSLTVEDKRHEQAWLGKSAGYFGAVGEAVFVVEGGDVRGSARQAFTRVLEDAGWRVGAAGPPHTDGSDVSMRVEILDLAVNGVAQWFATALTCSAHLLVEVHNQGDGRSVMIPLSAERSEHRRWVGRTDAEMCINAVLNEAFGRLQQHTRRDGLRMIPVHL